MNSKIRFGVIGCSSIAMKSAIPAIIDGKNSTLKMIGSRSITKARKFAKKFSCSEFGNYEDVLKNDNVDAVYISLPMNLHEKWAIKAAKSGKHVLCEKSAVLSHNSAKKVIAECKKNNVRIMENFIFKFHPQHKKILELIAKNTIGDIHTISAKYGFNFSHITKNFRFNKKLGGGSLNDVGCYLISACIFIFKDIPVSVCCNLDIDKKSKIDIRGNILLTFPNNKTGLLSFGYDNYFQSTYEIWGTKGIIKSERAFNVTKNMKTVINLFQNDKIKKITIPPANQFQLAIEHFCTTIQKNVITDNFEKDILDQALIMDVIRKASARNSFMKIKS
ncbi:Gfo/Idh/MocA family oxidoreductase [Candidatus Nitrosopumilus sp. SW]|uniref:Gfo/Idh/MocA family protein n=1 Tax=Candidatus Nitrosopumilus sp. SW TaxID=2508726 RepID=UPI0011500C40|nr:Gfo/Idh/MocA family oxidoreductase [Candidatus Nitrosopumilus sp. SW]QDI88783.1 Gfo/Idh/MocA family oxidoreductase [Candidatus Nitrosopumilus sp. SW]